MYKKGNVYWYKSNKKVYCFAVLEIIEQKDYLIAISEEITGFIGQPSCVDARESDLFTVAWFDILTLLPPFRIHFIYQEIIEADYFNRAGIWIDSNRYTNRNPGDKSIWRHERRNYAIRGIKLKDTFDTRFIPRTVIS